ncbi:hypothetical protein cypCar_00042474, partial [Cyprinus carpio]
AAVGPLLAGLISPTGWNNVFYMLIAADVLACLLLSRLVYKEVRGWCGYTTRLRGGFICSFLSGSKRSEPPVEQENITPATENYLQHNDKKGPRIDATHQAFLCPRVILYENCNMRLSSFYTDNGTKLSCCSEGGGELHTPSSTRSLSGTKNNWITKLLHFNT